MYFYDFIGLTIMGMLILLDVSLVFRHGWPVVVKGMWLLIWQLQEIFPAHQLSRVID